MANHTTKPKPKSNWTRTTSRHERGYGYSWEKLRLTILARDLYLCQPCLSRGRPTQATEVDHIKAKANGGTDEPGNLMSICHSCHVAKTATDSGYRPKVQIGRDGWPMT